MLHIMRLCFFIVKNKTMVEICSKNFPNVPGLSQHEAIKGSVPYNKFCHAGKHEFICITERSNLTCSSVLLPLTLNTD